jgi:hypothetical protein
VRVGAESCADLCGPGRGCNCVHPANPCVGNPVNQSCPTVGALCEVVSSAYVTELECEAHP